MVGVTEGNELLINGRRVVIRGNDVRDIKTQIKQICVNAYLMKVTTPISCTGNPLPITNGCGGGFKAWETSLTEDLHKAKTTTQQYVAPLIGSDPTAENLLI